MRADSVPERSRHPDRRLAAWRDLMPRAPFLPKIRASSQENHRAVPRAATSAGPGPWDRLGEMRSPLSAARWGALPPIRPRSTRPLARRQPPATATTLPTTDGPTPRLWVGDAPPSD